MEVDRRGINIKTNNGFESGARHEKSRYTLSDLLPITRFAQKMSSTSILKPSDKFTIDVVTNDDIEEVLQLLKTFFFKDEPLNTYLELGECKDLEEYSIKCIPDKCSFKAVNSDGEIIGVFLNGVYERPSKDYTPTSLAESCKHEKFRKILGLMDFIDTKFNIFDYFPTIDRILDGKIVSVNQNYRGLGIAGHLTNRTIEFMREHKIPLMNVLCTSHYSARVMEKLDFDEVFRLPFTDYVNADGKQVLKPAEPHTHCRILVKRID